MTEDFLQFIWKYGLFDRNNMTADTGDQIEVISLGEHNTDSGPDFLNSRIKIDDTVWAGNVELHQYSSDWITHKHHTDSSYENVILHVVYRYDKPVYRKTGAAIPTVTLKFDNNLYENYRRLLGTEKGPLCVDKIKSMDALIIDGWLNALLIERLQQKTQYITGLLDQYRNNWEEVCYISLARAFGFGLNSIPFEMTARSLSLAMLTRHRYHSKQVEALLFGQAGFLNEALFFNSYYQDLRMEYLYLSHKYNLTSVQKHLWKFLRLRPVNFPTVRIAQFAVLLQKSEGLFSQLIACENYSEAYRLFEVSASVFWNTHYTFDTDSPEAIKRFGDESVNVVIINAVIPLLFTYGMMTANQELKDRAVAWLSQIPPERNRIVGHWTRLGLVPGSALYSQAFLQLYNHYCRNKKCLACSIGANYITR